MSYVLDPRLIVRIWFSKDPKKAINFENRQRLINLRSENPDVTISLVYAKKLLSENAITELNTFCRKYKITLVSMEDDVIPYCTDKEEKNLVSIYEKEINALHDGGNLAAASDIVRWLKPVYSRGIYSDFDTKINVAVFKEKITVEVPILLNIGSLEFPVTGLPCKSTFETITLNNDIIAVVGDDAQTHELIKNIQSTIYNGYEDPKLYSRFYYQLGLDLSDYIGQYTSVANGFKAAGTFLESYLEAVLANQLFRRNADPISIRKQLLEENKLGDLAFCRRQLDLITGGSFSSDDDSVVKREYLQFLTRSYRRLANEKDITSEREIQCNKLYIASVTHATGPNRVALALFKNVALTATDIDKKVMIYSFHHYDSLRNVFSSLNSFAPHTSQDRYLEQIAEQQIGVVSDQSWTDVGDKKRIEREEKAAVMIIQRFFRAHNAKHKNLNDQVDSTSVINPAETVDNSMS